MTITEILNILWPRVGILVKNKNGKTHQPIFTNVLMSHIRTPGRIELLMKSVGKCPGFEAAWSYTIQIQPALPTTAIYLHEKCEI